MLNVTHKEQPQQSKLKMKEKKIRIQSYIIFQMSINKEYSNGLITVLQKNYQQFILHQCMPWLRRTHSSSISIYVFDLVLDKDKISI